MVTKDDVVEKLKTIYDPEIPVNIYDLGLIYGIDISDGSVSVTMTLTTASCPAAAFMPEEVKAAVGGIAGVQDVSVQVVYEPRWTNALMSPEAKAQLGF